MNTNRSTAEHWDEVYCTKAADQTSWHLPHLTQSVEVIESLRLPRGAPIIDIGAGASSLIGDLLALGYTNLTALDIAQRALDRARAAIPNCPDSVKWLCADVRTANLPERAFDLWHDRAAFHFLTDPADRARYAAQARRALKPGAWILIAGFAPDGPQKCSGLEVFRASPEEIGFALGDGFEFVSGASHTHTTPWGSPQRFSVCLCRRRAAGTIPS